MRLRSILFVFAILPLGVVSVAAQDQIGAGTINLILANREGVVVLTDSKMTWKNAAGKLVRSTNAQKLIRIDDESVVALAGFAGAPDFLRLDVMGLLVDVRDRIAEKNRKLSLDEKMKLISFLVRHYMDALVNVNEIEKPGQNADPFRIHFFIAGFDTDGAMKIGSMWLRAYPTTLPEGGTRWQVEGQPDVRAIGEAVERCKIAINPLEYCSVGYSDIADKIMAKPHSYASVNRLLRTNSINGATRIENLEALAKVLSVKAANVHSDKVGGPDQIAIFHGGKIAKFDAPSFPQPLKPAPFSLIIDVHNAFIGPGARSISSPGVSTIWIRDTIRGDQQLTLDGNLFLGNEIIDSTVRYGGHPTVFDLSNKVVNSTLWLDELGSDAAFLHSLTHDFAWQQCLPFGCDVELPRNQPID